MTEGARDVVRVQKCEKVAKSAKTSAAGPSAKLDNDVY